jgi:hypothetical protein
VSAIARVPPRTDLCSDIRAFDVCAQLMPSDGPDRERFLETKAHDGGQGRPVPPHKGIPSIPSAYIRQLGLGGKPLCLGRCGALSAARRSLSASRSLKIRNRVVHK